MKWYESNIRGVCSNCSSLNHCFRPPNCNELNTVREEAEEYLPVFRHCQQCRADACGIPGANLDFANLLYEQPQQTFSHG